MGTRADFYLRKDSNMTWLGSKAWDGYPEGIDQKVLKSITPEEFQANTEAFLKENDDATFPDEGWPWPWSDSRTTDYSYVFENGKVMASNFGYPLFDPLKDENEESNGPEEKMNGFFPDMKDVKNVKMGGKGSGLIIVSINKEG